MSDFQALARRIRRDSPSLQVRVLTNGVLVQPAFQHALTVTTWEQYEQAVQSGRILFPDQETCYGEGS